MESRGEQEEDEFDPDEPVRVPIRDELDLHAFQPGDLGSLLPEYFRECRKQGLERVRIIHGKGTGALREGVHRLLERSPVVISYRTGDETEGSWGATMVRLTPWTEEDEQDED